MDADASLLGSALLELCARERAFTTDDIWMLVGRVDDGRSIANAMVRAERDGVIVNSRLGAYMRGQQKHLRWLTVWVVPQNGGTVVDAAEYAAARFRS
jgi:hypothetical protein